jgi:predicted deacylase
MPPRPRFRWRIALAVFALLALGLLALWLREPAAAPAEPVAPPAPVLPVPAMPARATVGTSVEGRTIEAYTYGSGETRLLFVGGIHGGYEWNSVVLAYQMMDYLEANPAAIPGNLSVTIVPNANPDGVFKVVGKEGRFTAADVPAGTDQSLGRFNARGVDLNRNFDCRWQPESTWRSKIVSAGTAPFSEPEAAALRDLVAKEKPVAAVFWHSQANAVYASACEAGVLPETRAIMSAYAAAAGYSAVESFDAYPVTGAAEDWLASIGVPAITVEFSSHESLDWEKNLAGVRALLARYAADV